MMRYLEKLINFAAEFHHYRDLRVQMLGLIEVTLFECRQTREQLEKIEKKLEAARLILLEDYTKINLQNTGKLPVGTTPPNTLGRNTGAV